MAQDAEGDGPRWRAIVSRGGRPDLVGSGTLARVHAPALFLVGERDKTVPKLNRRALQAIRCRRELVVVPGASHLFEERGALKEVARLAAVWFDTHVRGGAAD